MRILAIESTCDETAAAVVENFGKGVKVLKNVVASSAEIHQKYGGVVPEVAAREQIKSIIPVINEVIKNEDIEAIAVSYGPGLMGSLLIGVETAKALAWAWKKPLLKVNHLVAHLMANWISDNGKVPEFPAIGWIVSGGHTDLILMKSIDEWEWIGGTRDDAAGEAFDKAARLLGLPYPGGPAIDKAASQVDEIVWKNENKNFKLPRPLINDPRLELSFSGIKAAVSRMVQEEKDLNKQKKDLIAKEFNDAVTEVIVKKTMIAIEQYRPKSIILAGGVAANKSLREKLRDMVERNDINFFVPEFKYCGDNAAMVGAAAIMRPIEANLNLKPEPGLGVI